jgi:hypothetical protein
LSGDRLEPVAGEVDEEEQAEIVPQLAVDAVVVEEVAEVVEDARREAVLRLQASKARRPTPGSMTAPPPWRR